MKLCQVHNPGTANPFLSEEEKGYSKKAEDWDSKNTLARSRDLEEDEKDGAFGSCCYGGHILEALALIVGMKVEGV